MQRLRLEWCVVPVGVACLWLVIALVVSVVSVRRVMIREQRLHRVALRRIRRQHSRQMASSISSSEGGSTVFPASQGESLIVRAQRLEAMRAASGRRGRTRGEIPSMAIAAAAAADKAAAGAEGRASDTALTAAALSAATDTNARAEDIDADAASDNPTSTDADSSRLDEDLGRDWWGKGRGTEGLEGKENKVLPPGQKALTLRSSRRRNDSDRTLSYSVDSAADSVGVADTSGPAEAAAAAGIVPGRLPSRQSLRRRESDARRPVAKLADVRARSVRVSCLLNAWIRLWLSMAIFSITLLVFLVLISLRIFGVPASSLSTGAIASPGLVVLSLLALHSLVMLDGDWGSGGGAANRRGAARSRLGISRRSFIVLSLVCALLVVAKIDSVERDRDGKSLSALAEIALKTPWWCVLTPMWVMAALLEVVYLVALWENRAGESLASTLMGGADGAPGFLNGWGDACGECECPPWGRAWDEKRHPRPSGRRYDFRAGARLRPTAVSYSSSVRRRVELTPAQRAAAASLVGGILCLTVAMVAVSLRTKPTVSWSVPMTMLMAAAGMALVGTGLGQLAAAHCCKMRGPLPPLTTPLPVFFCERQGGWVVGPPDPPTVSIFLLGEVTLRQEGFGVGSAVGVEEGGGVGGGNSWAPTH